MSKCVLLAGVLFLALTACSHRVAWLRSIGEAERKFKDNTGFMLYDPASHKTLADYHAGIYFAPASNTKALTFYTSLHVLGDSVPAVRYITRHDSMIVWGTGDPSFLYKGVADNGRTYRFLQQSPQRLFVATGNFTTDHLGAGWMWDDYPYSFSAEKSAFPIYGNLARIRLQNGQFSVLPVFFQNHFTTGDTIAGAPRILREIDSNQITFSPGRGPLRTNQWEIPFHCSPDLLVELLSDTLRRQVDEIALSKPSAVSTFYSVPADSLYAAMMKSSDNFIAEQLLLLCAEKLSDTLNPDIAIRYATKVLLADLPDKPVWADGSGLSRYNLTTPRNMVKVWEKLYAEIPQPRLFSLIATGGKKGTLKGSYVAERPFIFGKSGSFANNSTLSGFLITKKARVLIFSFMNGNFVAPASEIRNMMETILTQVRDTY